MGLQPSVATVKGAKKVAAHFGTSAAHFGNVHLTIVQTIQTKAPRCACDPFPFWVCNVAPVLSSPGYWDSLLACYRQGM